jgi:putative transposase
MTEIDKPVPVQLYLITLNVAGNIDVFTRMEYKEHIVENLNYCSEHKNLAVYDYVLMTNRLHMIAAARRGHISRVLRDFKSITAKQILMAISESPEENRKEWLMRTLHFYSQRYQHSSERYFWQFGNNPVSLDKKDYQQARAGLLQVPVQARLVDRPEHYVYCSAYPQQRVGLDKWPQ